KFANPMAIPRLQKIVVSMGIGDGHQEKTKFENAQKHLTQITGQKPLICKARKAVSNFKLRIGYNVGLKVTLRGKRMYEFLDRLVSLAIPRVKDFRGLNPSSFDGRGNYNMGLDEQSVFPEIDPADFAMTQGMNITFQTSADTDEVALSLLQLMGMPFRTEN
ncbi:MAG TPA: 50S ribosomal protein L5, partial [Phycisphaerae bacterium]|nr:50S ribosomal protein L5 [Phycisphaerae bacterium]